MRGVKMKMFCIHNKVTKVYDFQNQTLKNTICNDCGFKKDVYLSYMQESQNRAIIKFAIKDFANNFKFFSRVEK